MSFRVRVHLMCAFLLCSVMFTGAAANASEAPGPSSSTTAEVEVEAEVERVSPMPVLAYYYIWYNPSSWRRAKSDFPLLGKYTSDETAIMRQHIAMAQSAGIEGFLVSWKDTTNLTPRLERLVEVAREMDFHLGIVYQGLDFEREPIPVEKVEHDLDLFATRYAADPVFNIFGRPVVSWTGTKSFSRADIERVRTAVDGRVSLLATAGSTDEYARVADLVDGNAHYWGAVNPDKPWYPGRMAEMGAAVHADGGIWIAPAAPGFDARLVGGTSVVLRRGSNTLATQLGVAASSGADAIGLISWNEFSENTQVEPSENYGTVALREVAAFSGLDPARVMGVDSSAPSTSLAQGLPGWAALGATGVGVVGVSFAARRSARQRGSGKKSMGEGYGW